MLARLASRARPSLPGPSLPSASLPRLSLLSANFSTVPASDDKGPFKEFSVVFTDRSLNHMAPPFVSVMQDLNVILKKTYNADKTVLIPGSGTYAMEAVARQFLPPTASNNHCRRSDTNKPIVLRNGWFSFRWSEIFETMGIGEADHTVLKAEPDQSGNPQYQPHNVDAVVAEILKSKPPVVFAPHVETSIGIILPDDYIRKVGAACQEAGALFVLDGIASGTVWVDMKDLNVDVFISAPQKGWSGPAAVGIAMLSDRAHARMMEGPESSSYTVNLKRWSGIMDLYDGGGFGYHCTMPTDAIRQFRDIAQKQVDIGLDKLKQAQIEMGEKARKMLESKGLKSAAADGAAAPGVLVYYSPGVSNPEMVGSFREHGMQIAAGVPWQLNEPTGLQTFRIGLFGIDKLCSVDETVATLETGIDFVMKTRPQQGWEAARTCRE